MSKRTKLTSFVSVFAVLCFIALCTTTNTFARDVLYQVDQMSDFKPQKIHLTSQIRNIENQNEQIRVTKDYSKLLIDITPESNEDSFTLVLENRIEDARVVEDSIIGSTDSRNVEIVDLFDGGFRKHFIINNRNEDELYECGIIPPNGYKFRFSLDGNNEEDGSVELINEDGDPVIAIYTPWAKDSSGAGVETYYVIENNRLYQKIVHKNMNYSYPIIADPTAQYNKWFSGTKWVNNSNGWTLSVAHSSALINEMNAKKGSMIASVTNTSWNTLYNQHKGSSHWKNTQGMKDQYKCHAFNAQTKSRWNLDTWRPNVGYTKTVLKACNP